MANILESLSMRMAQGMNLGLEQGTDVLEGMKTGQSIKESNQNMQIKAMEMQEYVEDKKREKRLRDALKGTDFGNYEESTEAAGIASEIDYKTGMAISKHAQSQKPKDKDGFGAMQDITIKGTKVGIGQYGDDGRLYAFKTNKQMTGDGSGLAKPTKARTPTKEQITRGTGMIEKSAVFGAGGDSETTFGLNTKDNKLLGRLAAARGQKLVSDAKQLGQTISDETGMSIAIQELEGMKDTIVKDDLFGRSVKDQKDIKFPPGISKELQNYLGVDASASVPSGVDMAAFAKEYAALPSGASYVHPDGSKRIKR